MFKKLLSIFKRNKNTVEKEDATAIATTEVQKIEYQGSELIKGNVNKKGDKIYHVPNGRFYHVTNASELFKSEEEAEEAGYRRSRA